ncbi:1561ca9a-3143-42d0-9a98-e30d1f5d6332 [Sclerotinia trifoliorum]|uniref:1561ca9a-3143-42d0-9a98-e30d1f5d6332 n=1 Tax=Sclerotinia trifoliorum TaxID=28548 RepID=A0A8H2VZ47_9HELO|nr:1561ca9a-3143-42d0-9a98-e30d1f5d6332 [Sclerotinia trifoliorum]
MSSQDASLLPDASIHQARRRSAVLTPSSQAIGQDDIASLGSKKRKRDGNSLEDLLKDTFIVKPYPSKVNTRPRSLQPLILLSRSHLPLSYLDIGSTTSPLPQSRLFETHVKILELEERMGNQPMVLIARLDDNRTLYAVERESRGLYVILQLGSWINIHHLKSSAVVAQTERPDVPVKGMLLGSAYLGTSTESLITPEGSKYNKKKRQAIEAIQSMIKRPSTPLLPEPRPRSVAPESLHVPEAENVSQATVSLPALKTKTQATAPEIFDNIRNQYFESLYLSKTSLAYFAKGPLSRARAAFHLDFDANLDMNDHIAFLESLVLSSTLLDKKYRDGVPACVSAIDIHDESADDATVKPKKRKGNKKMKPGKNGLYPNEESLIGKWWVGHDEDIESGAPGSSKDEMAKTRIANLRIRETQLQMIVILEILALQPLASTTENVEGGLPSLPSYDIIQSKERTPKTRKQDHLTMLIDVHIDRLCIWQSIATEAIKAPETSSDPTAAKSVNHTDNILKDFCIEVIAPFFSARLPDRCDAINRKLGGPITKSASKPRIPKSASFSNTPTRPGAVIKRPVPAKQRKSLQRVLTDDRERRSMSIGSNRAISLMRSATDPTIPGLKREASEAPSLSSIPFVEFKPLHANRGGVLNSKRFSQREIDMSTLAPDANSKAKKQAAIDAELKDAISALKKPNRELAGKSLVETAERRSALAGHPRKSKKPIRNPLFQGSQPVQIKATPKNNRRKDVFGESQSTLSGSRDFEQMKVGLIPPSSVPTIPQSKVRPAYGQDPFRDSVQATPSRKSFFTASIHANNFKNCDTDYAIPPSSPLQMRRPSAQLFNSIPESVVKRPVSAGPRGILETPIKRSSSSILYNGIEETPLRETPVKETPLGKISEWKLGHTHPFGPSHHDQENLREVPVALEKTKPTQIYKKEVSYYEALGWNDDDIDDLA